MGVNYSEQHKPGLDLALAKLHWVSTGEKAELTQDEAKALLRELHGGITRVGTTDKRFKVPYE